MKDPSQVCPAHQISVGCSLKATNTFQSNRYYSVPTCIVSFIELALDQYANWQSVILTLATAIQATLSAYLLVHVMLHSCLLLDCFESDFCNNPAQTLWFGRLLPPGLWSDPQLLGWTLRAHWASYPSLAPWDWSDTYQPISTNHICSHSLWYLSIICVSLV